MKAASAASLLLFLFSISVFGHGVERGSIWNGIARSDLGLLSERIKRELSEVLAARCDLTGAVSVSAEFAANEEAASDPDSRGLRIRILVTIENKISPETILVVATPKSVPVPGDTSSMEYSITSPLCH